MKNGSALPALFEILPNERSLVVKISMEASERPVRRKLEFDERIGLAFDMMGHDCARMDSWAATG